MSSSMLKFPSGLFYGESGGLGEIGVGLFIFLRRIELLWTIEGKLVVNSDRSGWKPTLLYSSSSSQTNKINYYKHIRLKVLLAIHIDEHLLRVHLLLRKLSAELSTQFATQKSLLTVNSLATLSTVHGLRSRAVQRRKLSLLADVVEKLNRSLGSQTLLAISRQWCY